MYDCVAFRLCVCLPIPSDCAADIVHGWRWNACVRVRTLPSHPNAYDKMQSYLYIFNTRTRKPLSYTHSYANTHASTVVHKYVCSRAGCTVRGGRRRSMCTRVAKSSKKPPTLRRSARTHKNKSTQQYVCVCAKDMTKTFACMYKCVCVQPHWAWIVLIKYIKHVGDDRKHSHIRCWFCGCCISFGWHEMMFATGAGWI